MEKVICEACGQRDARFLVRYWSQDKTVETKVCTKCQNTIADVLVNLTEFETVNLNEKY